MSSIVNTPAHLPSVTTVSLGNLILVILVCSLLEVLVAFVTWKACRVTRMEADLISQRQTLKTGVAKTNYSSTFVENSKLKRLLLKVEKDIGKIQAGKDTRQKATAKAIRAVRVCVYGCIVTLMWGRPLISFSPEFLWPSSFSHSLSGGRAAGSIGVLSVVVMFVFGLSPRFGPGG